jgi:hypothetical protein
MSAAAAFLLGVSVTMLVVTLCDTILYVRDRRRR